MSGAPPSGKGGGGGGGGKCGNGGGGGTSGGAGSGAAKKKKKKKAKGAPDPGKQDYATSAISEGTRIAFTQQLNQLREDPTRDELQFPPTLDNIERKFLHALAGQLGLVSKSRGKGEGSRYITVSKKKKGGGQGNDDEESMARFPPLSPTPPSLHVLATHASRFPLKPPEREALRALLLPPSSSSAEAEAEDGEEEVLEARVVERLLLPPSSSSSSIKKQGQHRKGGGGGSGEQGGHYSAAALQKRAAEHAAAQARRDAHPKYPSMLAGRKRLPAWEHREAVARMVAEGGAVIVSGETGCGKSTQVPQFLLDDPGMGPTMRMAVTQPRRISAIAVAERVAAERCEEAGRTVGYNIRLESQISDQTQVVFMTPGVLLRKLSSDPDLKEFSHVMIDEVHERDRNTDFLLIVLRDLLATRRPDLKLILMSATLQTAKLSAYFGGCPVATIGATCYPVQEFYLEDVLLQTGYVQKTLAAASSSSTSLGGSGSGSGKGGKGGKGKGGGPGGGVMDNPLLRALCDATPVYTCDMCGQRGFRSPEEFGTHIVLCDGGSGGGNGGGGGGAEDEEAAAAAERYQQLELSLLRDLQKNEGDYCPDYDDWAAPPPPPSTSALLPGLEAMGLEGGGGEGEGEEGEGYRHEAVVGQGIVRPMPKATEVQAQEALRAYQFDWDDENVDYTLIKELLAYIVNSGYEQGAILVFLPGWDDITRLRDLMRRDPLLGREDKFWVLPLHSGIPSKQQREVFKRPPAGCRKIVLATNIAETSITIDDVTFVVDSGRVKEKAYDPFLKLCTLQPTWISKASARQRRGRAGRTTAGVCFHLCSRRRFESLREFRESELLTTPLEELCLQAKLLGLAPGFDPMEARARKNGGNSKKLSPEAAARLRARALEGDSLLGFLGKALDPPHDLSVRNAIDLLVQIGAFTPQEELTELGTRLALLPMDPRIGKMVLWGQLLGCGRSALKVGCAMAYRDPFVLPATPDQKSKAQKIKQDLADGSQSDHLALLGAIHGFEAAVGKGGVSSSFTYCDRNFLSRSTLQTVVDVARQMTHELAAMGFDSPFKKGPAVERDHNLAVLTAVICAGLYPGVATRGLGEVNFSTTCGKKAKLSQGSVNCYNGSRFTRPSTPDTARLVGGGPEFLVFSEVIRTPSLFLMSNATPVPALALLLLCGELRVRGLSRLLLSPSPSPSPTPPAASAVISVSALESSNPLPPHNVISVAALEGGGGGQDEDEEEEEDDDDDEEEDDEEEEDPEAWMGEEALLMLDGWVTLRVPKAVALQLQMLRLRLQQAFLLFVRHPQAKLPDAAQDALRCAAALLTNENPYLPARLKGGAGGGGGGGGGGGRGGFTILPRGGRGGGGGGRIGAGGVGYGGRGGKGHQHHHDGGGVGGGSHHHGGYRGGQGPRK